MVIYRHKDKYSISEMCKFFHVSRSGYYGYVARMDMPAKDSPLLEKIKECQDSCGKTYGYRRVHIKWSKRYYAECSVCGSVHEIRNEIGKKMKKANILLFHRTILA